MPGAGRQKQQPINTAAMEQRSLFKIELTDIQAAGGLFHTIAESEAAIDELMSEQKDTGSATRQAQGMNYISQIGVLPTVKKLNTIASQVEELQSPEVYNNPHFDKGARTARIRETFEQLPRATQEATLAWIKDTRPLDIIEQLAADITRYNKPKTIYPDPDMKSYSPVKERREKIKSIQTAREIRLHLAHLLETSIQTQPEQESSQDISEQFKGIADELKPYMKGATEEIIGHIYTYKTLPEGAKPPKWTGKTMADASRFMHWCGMKEAAIKKCIAGIDKLHRGHKPSEAELELTGSIYDILKNYPKR